MSHHDELIQIAQTACGDLDADEILSVIFYMLWIGHFRREAAWRRNSLSGETRTTR